MTELKEGIIKEYFSAKIGVVPLSDGAGATTIAAALAHEISMMRGMTYYVGDATKEELGISKKLDNGHVYDKIYWAREVSKNFGSGYIVIDSPKELEGLDVIVCVVDPLPGQIVKNLGHYRELLELENMKKVKMFWVVNKLNQGVNLRELERFLKKHFDYTQSLIPADEIYRAQYRGILVYKNDKFKELHGLAQDIVEVL